MKTVTMALWAAAALAAAGTAAAENPAWTYGQLGYYRADSGNDATDGVRVKGSLGFMEDFHFSAEYIDGKIGNDPLSSEDTEFDGFDVELGYNPSVGDSTDAIVAIHYFDFSYDDDPFVNNYDVDGFGIGLGLRHMLTDKVELSAVTWWNEGNVDPDGGSDSDFTDTTIQWGGRYLFTDAVSVGVTFVNNDPILSQGTSSGDSATLDFRYQFDDML